MVIWITGLSGSGKTTIGKRVYENVKQKYENTVFLDGDIIRKALDNNYGYSLSERLRGAKQVSGLCKMLDNENINVICATMSLFEEIQEYNRVEIKDYIEVFLDVDINELKNRNKKDLYSGKIKDVVGVDLEYDIPANPELILNNNAMDSLDNNVELVTKNALDKIDNLFTKRSVDYWEEYYQNHKIPNKQSLFADFISSYISNNKKILELGCGNGRDSLYFSNELSLNTTGIDQCTKEIDFLNTTYGSEKLEFKEQDFTNFNVDCKYDYIYSRFTFHSIDEESETRTLDLIFNSLENDGLFFLEARSIKDELFGEGKRVGKNEYVTDHYRRFLVFDLIKKKVENSGLKIIYSIEDKGFAPHKDEDPYVIRIIAKR